MVNARRASVNRHGGPKWPPNPQTLGAPGEAVARLDNPYYTGDMEVSDMATMKQRRAARRNIKKAAAAAKRKQTLKHLPKSTLRALGKEAAKARRKAA